MPIVQSTLGPGSVNTSQNSTPPDTARSETGTVVYRHFLTHIDTEQPDATRTGGHSRHAGLGQRSSPSPSERSVASVTPPRAALGPAHFLSPQPRSHVSPGKGVVPRFQSDTEATRRRRNETIAAAQALRTSPGVALARSVPVAQVPKGIGLTPRHVWAHPVRARSAPPGISRAPRPWKHSEGPSPSAPETRVSLTYSSLSGPLDGIPSQFTRVRGGSIAGVPLSRPSRSVTPASSTRASSAPPGPDAPLLPNIPTRPVGKVRTTSAPVQTQSTGQARPQRQVRGATPSPHPAAISLGFRPVSAVVEAPRAAPARPAHATVPSRAGAASRPTVPSLGSGSRTGSAERASSLPRSDASLLPTAPKRPTGVRRAMGRKAGASA